MDGVIASYHDHPIVVPPLAGDSKDRSQEALSLLIDGLKLEKEQYVELIPLEPASEFILGEI